MNQIDWEKAVEFHGHSCPGLAIGFKAAEAARKKMGITFSAYEEFVCVTENDACGVDAVQLMTVFSLGKGNLIYRSTGKMAFNFFNRKNGDSLRMIVKPFIREMDYEQKQKYILNSPVDEIFDFMKPSFSLPDNNHLP